VTAEDGALKEATVRPLARVEVWRDMELLLQKFTVK